MSLEGAQRMALKAIRIAQEKNAGEPVSDVVIANETKISLVNIRDWFLTLLKVRYIDLVRTSEGYLASINERGRLELDLYEPFPLKAPVTQKLQRPEGQRTILFLSANPKDTKSLRLDEEAREVEKCFERGQNRELFRLVMKWAVTADDLRRAILDYEPEILHFSGHGSGASGLNIEDAQGLSHEISGEVLAQLFSLFHIKCVVLNACLSKVQAEAIVKHVDFVVGMNKAIGDEAAIKFSVGFYDGIVADRAFDAAFLLGKNAIKMWNLPEDLTPILLKR